MYNPKYRYLCPRKYEGLVREAREANFPFLLAKAEIRKWETGERCATVVQRTNVWLPQPLTRKSDKEDLCAPASIWWLLACDDWLRRRGKHRQEFVYVYPFYFQDVPYANCVAGIYAVIPDFCRKRYLSHLFVKRWDTNAFVFGDKGFDSDYYSIAIWRKEEYQHAKRCL